jgi:hypothetical protein
MTYNADAARAIREYLEGHGITTNAPQAWDLPAMLAAVAAPAIRAEERERAAAWLDAQGCFDTAEDLRGKFARSADPSVTHTKDCDDAWCGGECGEQDSDTQPDPYVDQMAAGHVQEFEPGRIA